MLSAAENERLTRVGPGTPMGELLRRYWFPIAASAQLAANPVLAVALLGEALVLYRDGAGRLGLLAQACPHRGTSLAYGIPEADGLRCAYHGWLFDDEGRCREQPAEPPDSIYKERIQARAYPVHEQAGLVFAYLGPAPAPLLPRYAFCEWPDASFEVMGTRTPCNWLQAMENLLDPYHVEALHGRFFEYVLQRAGDAANNDFYAQYAPAPVRRLAFEALEGGLVERKVFQDERDAEWRHGIPTFLPTTTLLPVAKDQGVVHFVVPLDDTHSWFLACLVRRHGARGAGEAPVPFRDVPAVDADGAFLLDAAQGQDQMALVSQGAIAARETEHLGTSDAGIVMYRQLLREQLERVQHGLDPLNVARTAAGSRPLAPR